MSARGWLLGLSLVAAPLGAAAAQETGTFYLIIGPDTAAVERFTRTATELTARTYIARRPGWFDMSATVDASGRVVSTQLAMFATDRDTVSAQRVSARFAGDSVGVAIGGGATNWVHVGASAIPNVNPSWSFTEQALIRARAMGGPNAPLSFMYLPNGPNVPATVTWIGADSATLQFAGVTMRLAVSPTGRLMGGTIPAQGARIVRGPASEAPAAPARKTYDAPAGAPYTAEEVVVVTKAGLHLSGTLTVPKAAKGRVPAIVTITGSGSQDRDEGIPTLPKYALYRQLADTLGRRGIAVLRMDDRGVNGSQTGPLTATTADFADDIRAGVAFLRTRADIDPKRIGLVGHSEGGSIGPMVAASDSTIAAVVVMAGAVSTGREIVTSQQRFVVDSMAHVVGQQRDAALAAYKHNTDSVEAAVPWWTFFLRYDGAATAARVRAPVLIVHGEHDYQVPVSEAGKLAAAVRSGGNRDVTVRTFPGANHLFLDDGGVGFSYEKLTNFNVRPDVLGTIADWLVARLEP